MTRWAVEKNMIAVDENLGLSCTRAMAMTFLWKAAGSPEIKAELAFTDVAKDAAYAPAVAWAVDQKITSGINDTTFAPDNTCTRGQIAAFLYRAANAASASAEKAEASK